MARTLDVPHPETKGAAGVGLSRRTMLVGAGSAVAGGTLLATPGAAASTSPRSVVPTPDGFTKFIVYLGQDLEGSSDPEVLIEHRREVHGESRSDVVALGEQAKQFFLDRFGLDFFGVDGSTDVGPWEIDGAVLSPSTVVTDTYRAHIVSEDWVDSRGWEVRDSGFGVSVTKDMVLHGAWGGAAGKPVPAGAGMPFGDYNIKVERSGRSERGEVILIRFLSNSPTVRDVDGTFHFICDLTHPDWGAGCACGTLQEANGAVRNVITFPPALR